MFKWNLTVYNAWFSRPRIQVPSMYQDRTESQCNGNWFALTRLIRAASSTVTCQNGMPYSLRSLVITFRYPFEPLSEIVDFISLKPLRSCFFQTSNAIHFEAYPPPWIERRFLQWKTTLHPTWYATHKRNAATNPASQHALEISICPLLVLKRSLPSLTVLNLCAVLNSVCCVVSAWGLDWQRHRFDDEREV